MLESLVQLTETYLNQGNIMVLAVVFLGGIITSFTPCLYPVIPLTVGYFSSQAEKSKLKLFFLAVIYVIGVSFVYTILGMAAALTGTLFGRIANHPYMYFTIANICIILGISMFGVFDISLPAFFQYKTGAKKKGYITSFLVGCSSGLVLGACATPIMAVLLTYAANKQNIVWGGILLLSFALGKGLLLIAIATFSGLMNFLPKSGQWMNFIKKILALFLIGMGEYYLIKMGQELF